MAQIKNLENMGYIRFIFLYFTLALLVHTPLLWADSGKNSVFKASLKGKSLNKRINEHRSLNFSVRTPDGNYKFRLSPRNSFRAKQSLLDKSQEISNSNQAKLYKGKAIWRDKSQPAAADLIGNKLRVRFKSFRSKRAYVATLPLSTLSGRLSHASIARAEACGTETPISNLRESATNGAVEAVFSPVRVLELSALADYQFYAFYEKDVLRTFNEMEAILNAAEAFYLDQIGMRIDLDQLIIDTNPNALKSTNAADIIFFLESLIANGTFNENSDAFHLFTGKDMDGATIGIARLGTLCQEGGLLSSGVSQKVNDSIQAIVTAHEIAHNLSAVHKSSTNIMNGTVRSNHTSFSPSSIGEITSYISEVGSCITESDGKTSGPISSSTPIPNPNADRETTEVYLDIDLRSGRKYKFNAFVESSGTGTNCSVSLYGSNRKNHLDDLLSIRTTVLSEGSQSQALESYQASFSMRRSKRKRKPVFFRAAVRCSGVSYKSNIVRARAKLPSKGAAVNRFLKKLSNSL